MTFLKKHYIALLLGFALPSFAMAAGLGRMTVQSALGQPLRADIEVVALQPGESDTLAAALASVASFRQSNIDYTGALQSIRFAIERRQNNQFVIALSSVEPMNEPFLDMLVELTWSAGRLVREYTFLLDPLELKPTVSAPTPPVAPPVVVPLAPEPPKPVAAPSPAVTTDNRPAAAAKPASRPAAKPAGQYEVKRGDTLAKIASQNAVAGATLQQMLAALYRGNEDAFDGKNMNRLRTGKILNLPAAEDVQSVTQNEAIQLVRSQASEYAEYQRTIGAAVAAAPERAAGSRQASGKITAPAVEKPAAKAAPKDQVRLSKPDDAKAGGKNAATAAADDAAAKDKALREAQERVALLEKNVQDLQKLLQLKSGSGAQAQKQAEAVRGPEVKAEPSKVSPAPAKADAAKAPAEPAKGAPEPAKGPEAAKAAATEAAKPADPDAGKAADAPKPAVEGGAAPDAEKTTPKPAAKAPPPPAPPPPDLVDQILDDGVVLGGAGAVVVLLGGYAFYAWRRKKKAASAEFDDSVASESLAAAAPSIASSAMADSEPVSASGESVGASSGGGGGDEIDPVAEADVYMAYGRDTQAEEILKEALSKDVNRIPVWLKLLEVYANRKDLATFESTAKDLQSLTVGQGQDWEKAQALGLQIDPANALYGGSGAAGGALDLGSTQIMSGADLAVASDATVIPDAAMGADSAAQVDFDLDLGDAPAEETGGGGIDLDLGAPASEAGSDAAMESTGSGLDFDLDLGGDEPAAEAQSDFSPQGTLIMDSTALPATETVSAPDEGGASIDFDLGMPGEPSAEAAAELPEEAAPVVTEDSGSTMDFNLNLDDAPVLPETPAEAAPATTDIDLSALSLDLGSDDAAESAAPMDAKWQEVATKLDLAKAYDEMGDKDGARDLLNEVIQEGDAAQKQQAKTMIDALG